VKKGRNFLIFLIFLLVLFFNGFSKKRCASKNGVLVFLVDNSKSVPAFDPDENRKEVLKEIEEIAKKNGYITRLVLFGGRNEIVYDDPSKFNNDGLHTDFYYAFKAAIDLTKEYSPDCKFKIVFITDGILDAYPSDYKELNVATKGEAMNLSRNMLFSLLKENRIPTYIILLGDKYDRNFINRIAQEANSSLMVNPLVEKVADILHNNSYFFKKFIYVVPENSPKKIIKRVVKQISQKKNFKFEMFFVLFIFLVGILIWFFSLFKTPAPGDKDIFQVSSGSPLFIGADRDGLKVVYSKYDAIARFSLKLRDLSEYKKRLRNMDDLNRFERALLSYGVREIYNRLKEMEKSNDDEEAKTAMDLTYYCSDLDDREIERIFNGPMDEGIDAKKFLMALVYLSMAPELTEKILKKRFFVSVFKGDLEKKELSEGSEIRAGGYTLKLVRFKNIEKDKLQFELEIIKVPFWRWKLLPPFLRKLFVSIFIKKKIRKHF